MRGEQGRLSMRAGTPRRRLALAALLLVALGGHLALLGGAHWPVERHAAAPLPQVMQVRTVEPVPEPAPIADVVSEAPAPVVTVPASLRPLPVSLAVAPPRPRPAPPPIADVASAAPMPSAPAVDVAIAAPSAEAPPPLYRTEMPPAATLRYLLQRGLLRGDGELHWRPGDGRYEIRLEGRVAGLAILTQVSTGGFDAAGLAPLRYTDQRPRRGVQAANFQRDVGKITFSGPSTEFPLVPGTQDRVSWMIQLAAAVAADPQRAAPGARTEFEVSGARADVDVWTFRSLGAETITAGGAPVSALHFIREPRSAYDTRVDVWLDPQQHHLPVRAALRNGDGEPLELVLRELTVGS